VILAPRHRTAWYSGQRPAGIMLAGAAQTYLNRFGVKVGRAW